MSPLVAVQQGVAPPGVNLFGKPETSLIVNAAESSPERTDGGGTSFEKRRFLQVWEYGGYDQADRARACSGELVILWGPLPPV